MTIIASSPQSGSRRNFRRSAPGRRQQGIALVVALLLLALMSVLGVVMMVSVNSDMLINGYYGNYRGSFYAADSGMNIARQQLANLITSAVSTTPCAGWATNAATGCTTMPLNASNGPSLLASLKSQYGSFTSLNSGQGTNSWTEWFQIADTAGCTNSVVGTTNPTSLSTTAVTTIIYQYTYTLCTVGQAKGMQRVINSETGTWNVTVTAQPPATGPKYYSFAAFGTFINNFPPCTGGLVPGTMTGPMFTNGAWQFGTSGSYIFTDPVGQANSKISYYFGSNCIQSSATSYTSGGQTIKPTYQGGINLSQTALTQPANDYSQKWAVLDAMGCAEGNGNVCGDPTTPAPPAVTNTNLHNTLRDVNGNQYPSGGATSGVYLPYSGTALNTNTSGQITAGGIYVEGNASVVLSVGTDGSGNKTQIYTITQGSTTTTVTTNPAVNAGAGSTTIVSGGTSKTLTGVPQLINPTDGSSSASTMLYVNGKISGLRGTAQGAAAIQDGSKVTITASGDVDITGDLLYKSEPVTLDTNNTLISANDTGQVLGIFTTGGNLVVSSSYSNQNLEIDGALAAIGSSCGSGSCGLTTSSHINTLNIVGGRNQSNILTGDVDTRNIYFDRRFINSGGFAPPWFPATTIAQNNITTALPPVVTTSKPMRKTWTTAPQ